MTYITCRALISRCDRHELATFAAGDDSNSSIAPVSPIAFAASAARARALSHDLGVMAGGDSAGSFAGTAVFSFSASLVSEGGAGAALCRLVAVVVSASAFVPRADRCRFVRSPEVDADSASTSSSLKFTRFLPFVPALTGRAFFLAAWVAARF